MRMPPAANRGVIRASLFKNAGGILESNSPIVVRQKLQHAVAELAAASIADELIGQPLRWQVRGRARPVGLMPSATTTVLWRGEPRRPGGLFDEFSGNARAANGLRSRLTGGR